MRIERKRSKPAGSMAEQEQISRRLWTAPSVRRLTTSAAEVATGTRFDLAERQS